MNIELLALFYAILLGILHLGLASAALTRQRGVKWNLSARDEKPPEPTGIPARLDRAFQNFKESFPFFVGAVVLVVATGKSGWISETSACLYLAARVIYLPIYASGITVIRTLIWGVSMLGILGVLAQVFLV